jgi:hypothetical protein
VRARRPGRVVTAGPLSLNGWLVVAGGVATAAVILGAWFPLGALLNQHDQLTTASTRLDQLNAEGRNVAAQTERLSSPVALEQLAREEYQLVLPGQRLILVETPSFRPTTKSSSGPYPGDPGFAPLVNPDGTSTASGATGATNTNGTTTSSSSSGSSHSTTSTASSEGFVSRVLGTLEFWR